MNWLTKFKNWLASLGTSERIDMPTDGRSSVEKIGMGYGLINATNRYSGVSPLISFEMLACLKQLWLYHPEFSQHVGNLVSLANTGHQISVDVESESAAERAVNRLNETAARIYKRGGGVDGLINSELTMLAWSGAISNEDVINLRGRRIEKVVTVPVEDIRFDYIDGEWCPFQKVGFGFGGNRTTGLVPLHPETYSYYAIETVDNSPYAKPPATAAVEAITNMQNEVVENVKYIVNKFSILGLLSVMVRRLTKRRDESDSEFNSRSQDYLKKVRDSLSSSFNKGLLVAYDNMQFKGENVAANGQGFYDVYRVIAETVMSGLRQQPAFFGRTDSTTETYADVVYQLLLANAHNLQRLVKRRREKTYRLDLRLAAIDVGGISLTFNKAYSRSILTDAQAEQILIDNVLKKGRAGIISADEAAQELGYDSAFDPAILEENADFGAALQALRKEEMRVEKVQTYQLKFHKDRQRYEYRRPRIQINSFSEVEKDVKDSGSNVVPIKKKQTVYAN